MLLVAFGNPLQERWILDHSEALQVPLVFGVGALLDFLSGTAKRAPNWVRRLHMEWMYRLLNEPQFDEPSVVNGGHHVVTTFIEVEGAGDYLPPYAGNLDIMTAAATKVGEEIAKEVLAATTGGHA